VLVSNKGVYPEWRIRQFHNKCMWKIMKRLKMLHGGKIVRYYGADFLKEIGKYHHSQMGFVGCSCNKLINGEVWR
jgi:hypothetical protein